jgi:hypothetical protein
LRRVVVLRLPVGGTARDHRHIRTFWVHLLRTSIRWTYGSRVWWDGTVCLLCFQSNPSVLCRYLVSPCVQEEYCDECSDNDNCCDGSNYTADDRRRLGACNGAI